MKNLAVFAAAVALAAGLAACSSSGGSTGTAAATATTAPTSGTETIYGKLTGSAAMSGNPVFPLMLTGPVGTTATISLGTSAGPVVPETGTPYRFSTPVGNLAVTLASAGTSTAGLKSAQTCLYATTTTVPFTVDGAKSTGKFAGAAGTGTAVVVFAADDPKFSNGTCNDSATAQPSTNMAVATLTATITLTVRQ